ncbi:MAG: hypothetical protein HeimC3_04930 [Candidatus Heimdallarchaeota archaeon LC_3]|nr:MAG: hypothetical protein HeimC3_04930 [Candidatus Heimdallarchaeota archaeon LC_3]
MNQLLIIESNTQDRELISHLISNQFPDSLVKIEINGEDGIKKLSTKAFDIVISEIYLFKVSGFDIIRFIKEKQIQCMIIALTGATISKTLLIEKGFNYVIKKNDDYTNELISYVRSGLNE